MEKIALEAPSAIYELECITWILAPRDGQPTWIRMADPTTGSAADAQSKLAHSIDAAQMAQQPMATGWRTRSQSSSA